MLDLCPDARLVTNLFSALRMTAERMPPLDRVLIVNPGESFDAGDRTLTAIVPPTYDSPTTRGLYDPTTGVYWAADSFAAETARPVDDPDEVDTDELRENFLHSQRMVSPWHELLDPTAYGAHLALVSDLAVDVAVGAHGPAFRGPQVARAFEWFAELPSLPAAPLVGQGDLEMLLSMLGAGAAA